MLDINKAIRIAEHYSGQQKRRTYIFKCKFDGCNNTIKVAKSALVKVSGYCRHHGRANLNRPFGQAYDAIKRTARHKKLSCSLTYDQFMFLAQICTCHYCGEANITRIPFGDKGATTYNLDRKNNSKGYDFDNLVVCCTACNMMKRNWPSYEEFKALRLFLKHWRNGTPIDKEELMYFLVSWNMKVGIIL